MDESGSRAWQLLMQCARFGDVELAFQRSAIMRYGDDSSVAVALGKWRAGFECHDGLYRFEVEHADAVTAVARLAELVMDRYVKQAKEVA